MFKDAAAAAPGVGVASPEASSSRQTDVSANFMELTKTEGKSTRSRAKQTAFDYFRTEIRERVYKKGKIY